MDQSSFDRIAKLLAATTTRRDGIRGFIAALAGLPAAAAVEARHGHAPQPAGPCGDGSGADNACKRDKQCCTGYCKPGSGGATGRCRCAPKKYPCTKKTVCCGGTTCQNGACMPGNPTPPPPAPIPTGQPCVAGSDTCANAAASCIAYDSDDPAGTYCILPTGASCSGNGDCYSQDCASGSCAAVVCDVCSSSCAYSDLDSAITGTADSGRIRIAAGTWAGPTSADVSKSLRFEACGGVSGVIIQPTDWLGFQAIGTATVTLKNLEFNTLVSGAFGASGTSAASVPTLIARGCTVTGADQYSLYQSYYSHTVVEDCSFTGASVYLTSAFDPSEIATMTLVRTLVTAPGSLKNTFEASGQSTITLTDSTFSAGDGTDGSGIYLALTSGSGLTLSVTLDGTTTVTGNTASGHGGGIYAIGGAGNTIAIDLKDSVTVTGNTASIINAGSGLAADVPAGATVTVAGGGTRITGNVNDPQCTNSTDGGTNWTAVADCASF